MANESEPDQKSAVQHGHNGATAPEQESIAPRYAITGAVIVVLVFAVLAVFGILSRRRHDSVLA